MIEPTCNVLASGDGELIKIAAILIFVIISALGSLFKKLAERGKSAPRTDDSEMVFDLTDILSERPRPTPPKPKAIQPKPIPPKPPKVRALDNLRQRVVMPSSTVPTSPPAVVLRQIAAALGAKKTASPMPSQKVQSSEAARPAPVRPIQSSRSGRIASRLGRGELRRAIILAELIKEPISLRSDQSLPF